MPRTSGATTTLRRDGTSNIEEMTTNDRSTGLRVFVPMLGVGLLTGFGASTATEKDCGVTRDLALVNGSITRIEARLRGPRGIVYLIELRVEAVVAQLGRANG